MILKMVCLIKILIYCKYLLIIYFLEIDRLPDSFVCDICDKEFLSEQELSEHNSIHFNTNTELKCEHCGKIFNKLKNLCEHSRSHNKREHICEVCNKAFLTIKHLNNHMDGHLEGEKYSCKICGAKFKRKSQIKNHVENHRKEHPHICHICNKGFKKSYWLVDHIYSHTGEKRYECPICYKKFIHRNALRVHKRRHDPTDTFICEKCGHAYSVRKTATHYNCPKCLPEYVCEICSKSFKHRPSFMRHIKIHTGTKEHVCHICNHGFIQKAAYNTHMNSHKRKGEDAQRLDYIKRKLHDMKANNENNVERYYCHICNENLDGEEEAKKHIEIHNGRYFILRLSQMHLKNDG